MHTHICMHTHMSIHARESIHIHLHILITYSSLSLPWFDAFDISTITFPSCTCTSCMYMNFDYIHTHACVLHVHVHVYAQGLVKQDTRIYKLAPWNSRGLSLLQVTELNHGRVAHNCLKFTSSLPQAHIQFLYMHTCVEDSVEMR